MSYEEWTDEFDDDFPEEEVPESDDDSSELMPCPNCGCEIYEESTQCPVCGEYVTFSTTAFSGRVWWWIALGILGSAATIYALLRG